MALLDQFLASLMGAQTPWAQQQMNQMLGQGNMTTQGAPELPVSKGAANAGAPSMGLPATDSQVSRMNLGGPMPGPQSKPVPAPAPAPMSEPTSAPVSFGTYLSGALRGASQANNPIGMLLGGLGGAMGAGEQVDQRNQLYKTLLANGMSAPQAALFVQSPAAYQMLNKGQEMTSALKEYQFARSQGYQGTFQDYQVEQNKAKATNVNVGAGDKAWDVERAKLSARRLDDMQKASVASQEQFASLEDAERALSTYNKGSIFGSGGFGEGELSVRRLAGAIGVGNPDTLAAGELAQATRNKMALLVRNPDSGMGMPGAMSDADREFLKASQPGIDKSELGNINMISAARRVLQRKVEMAQAAERWAAERGSMDGFTEYWTGYMKANPMFTGLQVIQPGGAQHDAPPGATGGGNGGWSYGGAAP